jgi:hypothetical protein
MSYLTRKSIYSLLQLMNNNRGNFQEVPKSLANSENKGVASLEELSANPASNDLIAVAVFPSEFLSSTRVNKNLGRNVIKMIESLTQSQVDSITNWISTRFPSFDDSQLFDGIVAGAYLSQFWPYLDRGKSLKIHVDRWFKLLDELELPKDYVLEIDVIYFGQVSEKMDYFEYDEGFPISLEIRQGVLAHAPYEPKLDENWYKFRLFYQPVKGGLWTTVSSSHQRDLFEERGLEFDER